MPQTPIVGKAASGEMIKSFRAMKMKLKGEGYPMKETRDLVKEVFEFSSSKWEKVIDQNTVLLKVPSGSGENKITIFFANQLAKTYKAQIVGDGLIMRQHRLEAKTNLSLEQRISDPVGYNIYAKELKNSIGNKKVVIVDDLIGSGESAVKLKKTLEANGIAVSAMVNLVTVESRYPTVNDIGRLVEKVAGHRHMTPNEKENFWKDTALVFGDYTRQKLNRVERHITGELSGVGAYEVIRRAAVIERKFINDLTLTKSPSKNNQLSL